MTKRFLLNLSLVAIAFCPSMGKTSTGRFPGIWFEAWKNNLACFNEENKN